MKVEDDKKEKNIATTARQTSPVKDTAAVLTGNLDSTFSAGQM